MFLSNNKKNNVYHCKPQFYYINMGFKGIQIILVCFRDVTSSFLNSKQVLIKIYVGYITIFQCIYIVYIYIVPMSYPRGAEVLFIDHN